MAKIAQLCEKNALKLQFYCVKVCEECVKLSPMKLEPDYIIRVQTFLGDLKKSPIGDFRRPYFFKKETKRRLKKETFGRMRSYQNIPVYT